MLLPFLSVVAFLLSLALPTLSSFMEKLVSIEVCQYYEHNDGCLLHGWAPIFARRERDLLSELGDTIHAKLRITLSVAQPTDNPHVSNIPTASKIFHGDQSVPSAGHFVYSFREFYDSYLFNILNTTNSV